MAEAVVVAISFDGARTAVADDKIRILGSERLAMILLDGAVRAKCRNLSFHVLDAI